MSDRLTKISIHGFKSFEHIEDLGLRDVNVLIGANGSGKSNFLEFLCLLQYLRPMELQYFVGLRGGANCLLHFGARRTPSLSAHLEVTADSTTATYDFHLVHAQPDKLMFASESLAFAPQANAPKVEESWGGGHFESLIRTSEQGSAEPIRSAASKMARMLGSSAMYHFQDTSSVAPIRLSQQVMLRRPLSSNASNLASFLWRVRGSHYAHYLHIVETIRLVMPFFRDFVLDPMEPGDGRSVMLRWRSNDPDYEFGPHQLPDGELRAIALITLLLQPEELMPSIILIDEPELGLHPFAVSLIGQLIMSVSTSRQVIVATQSPRLLREFQPEDVLVVENAGDASMIDRLSADDLGGWLDGYNGDLGALFEMNVTRGAPV